MDFEKGTTAGTTDVLCEIEDMCPLRGYGFVDMGNGYVDHPMAGEDAYTFALSSGVGVACPSVALSLTDGYHLASLSG
ncbi:hypothetical protein RISK_000865 [Rhodopirellula islandica]|uniref:Uncharacterized protein n=1 Tax=Rhodopirellula islandica TaxID=595434 RepID=A0A0J1ENH6_RHOIS|nr:hypothetical protein [Rhodopirellula islandica]KLU07064.1 hypothetical protein RISK_000865 [Rhodopirellula islandica]